MKPGTGNRRRFFIALSSDLDSSERVLIPENLGREGLDDCALLPRIERQACLPASLLEESGPIPTVFDRHLRQKQAATAVDADQQPVMANFDGVGKDWPGRGKDTEFNLQLLRFFSGHGWEAIVVKCCCPCRFCDSAINRAGRQHIPDASSQGGVSIQRSESAPRLGQVRRGRIQRDFPVIQRGKDRLMRQPQQ